MAREWTSEQRAVIEQRGTNLLVAAAAGSGKTAVMVERIIRRVIFDDNPIDIDRIVVVTFTKAAAAEMKQRIANAFMDALEKETDKQRLIRIRTQLSLLENANICTIDSYCNYILKNYFNTINLDPAFRIADEGELKLIMADVVEEVIEKAYEKRDKIFTDFIESYLPGKSDEALADWIIKLYETSNSHPYSKDWLLGCMDFYKIDTPEKFTDSDAVKFIIGHLKKMLASLLEAHKQMLSNLSDIGGIEKYIPAFESDIKKVSAVLEAKNYDEIREKLDIVWEKLSAAPKGSDETLKAQAQECRKNLKDSIKDFREKLFTYDVDTNVAMIQSIAPFAKCFIELVLSFTDRFDEEKREENILSFSDVEHLALNILVEKDEASIKKTPVAKELSEYYHEIYIDEYQDSNLVQEYILSSVSNGRNMFMVGDIKQSIYSFRQADPSIFISKYDSFGPVGSQNNVLITLHRNFRSQKNVLFCVNDIFEKTMHAGIGGVEYNEDAKLVPKDDATDEKNNNLIKQENLTELIICGENEEKDSFLSNSEEKKHTLALAAAKRIKELINNENELIFDKMLNLGNGGYRKITYRDIVILLRSANVSGPIYADVLNLEGIPAVCNTTTGYFSAMEIVQILNLLRVIDNPYQDIPLASALRSFFCYLSAEELARIKAGKQNKSLYDCVKEFAYTADEADSENENIDVILKTKLSEFIMFINEYRELSKYTPIHELLRELIYNTGYITFVAAKKGGKLKVANLEMLISKAAEYEKTSFHGLFNFLRYIDKIEKYEIDMGQADIVSENDDVVRIMSIHKSKGLEFPIVFVADMEKKYNLLDSRNKITSDAGLGIAFDYVDLELRIKKNSFLKRIVSERMRLDACGEELRILYVALTRAVDKLILLASGEEDEGKKEMWKQISQSTSDNYDYIYSSTNYLDIVAPAFFGVGKGEFDLKYVTYNELASAVTDKQDKSDKAYNENEDKISRAIKESMNAPKELLDKVSDRFEYKYPYERSVKLPAKFSVSELKHEAMVESVEEGVSLIETEEKRYSLLDYTDDGKEDSKDVSPEDEKADNKALNAGRNQGAERGNAYHKIFELLDYSIFSDGVGERAGTNEEKVKAFIYSLVERKAISEEYARLVNPKKFVYFQNTELGRRMKKAALSGKMYREKQFVAGFAAKDIKPKEYENCDDMLLVQGIIDCFFEEDGGIVIVDYKTDSVNLDNYEMILSQRYKEQLRLYANAVCQITGKKVKECVIYSVAVNREVKV